MRVRWIAVAFAILLAAASSAHATLLIHLPMTEGSGGTTANTGSIGGNATLQSGLTWEISGGPAGQMNAISYGTTMSTAYDDGILLPPSVINNQLDNLAVYTVTLWVRQNASLPHNNAMHTLYDTQQSSSSDSPSLWIDRDGTSFDYRDTGDRFSVDSIWSSNVGTWQFVAFTLQGDGTGDNDGIGRIYTGSALTSATLVATLTGIADNTRTAGDRFKIGASLSAWGVENMPGAFADVRLYDQLLDLSAIEDIRHQALTPEPLSLTLLALGTLGLLRRRRRQA